MTGDGFASSEGTCPGCHRALRPGMNYCPGCGRQLREGAPRVHDPPYTSTVQGAMRFAAPVQAQAPPFMAPYGMYPPLASAKRSGAIASAVFSLISASFSFIGGLVYLFQGLWFEDLWVLMAALCFIAFALAILGTIAIARRTWRFVALLSDLALVGVGVFIFIDMDFVGIVVLSMALVAITLLMTSWGQFAEELPWGQPLPYPRPHTGSAWQLSPSMGARPPHPGDPPMGAPPPSTSWDGGPVEEIAGED